MKKITIENLSRFISTSQLRERPEYIYKYRRYALQYLNSYVQEKAAGFNHKTKHPDARLVSFRIERG